jgi:hypothetical protein
MVMSASPSPSMSPSMVMPSVVIVSSPLCRNSTPPASDASNLIVSGSAAPLALASPSASRSERPLPSGAAGVSLPSNVSSASVVTVNSAMTAPPCHPRGDVSARLSARSPAPTPARGRAAATCRGWNSKLTGSRRVPRPTAMRYCPPTAALRSCRRKTSLAWRPGRRQGKSGAFQSLRLVGRVIASERAAIQGYCAVSCLIAVTHCRQRCRVLVIS